MAQKNNSKNVSVGKAVGFAAGLAALAAGSYFIFGPQGAKNRKVIKGWTLKAKGEVLGDEVTALATDLKKHWKAISRDLAPKKKAVKKVVKKVIAKIVK